MMTCGGMTKQNKPCRIAWDLDNLGYCRFHSPYASQCLGIARSTGLRCRITWDLTNSGFCSFHVGQDPLYASCQCIGWASTRGRRCQVTSGLNTAGYCSAHRPRVAAAPVCQGTLLRSRAPCSNVTKPGYAYCCASHDPGMPYYSLSLFKSETLTRDLLEGDVVARYNGRDLYHADPLDLATPGWVELDHILEKQCFSYAFHFLDFQDDEEKTQVAAIVREEVVNEVPNLCLTRRTTNRIKGAAVFNYLDDSLTGHAGHRGNGATFVAYVLAETRDSTRLGRHTTRKISQEMGSALKVCQRKLAAEGETPILDALSQELQNIYVTMQLHTGTRRRSSL